MWATSTANTTVPRPKKRTGRTIATEDELDALNATIEADAADAVAYALTAAYPDAAEVDMHVYAA